MPFCCFCRTLTVLLVLQLLWIYTVTASVNLAIGQTTKQSSTSQNFPSRNAVDGRFESCAITNQTGATTSPYWQVTLQQRAVITHIRYSFQPNGQFQLKYLPGHRIYISDSSRVGDGHLCYTEERNIDELNRYQNKIFCYSAGKYITYFHPTQDFEISLCEFEVYGCPVGLFDEECSSLCDGNCLSLPCEPDFGRCINGCQAGFSGEQCRSTCSGGTYGPNCALACSSSCSAGQCNPVNGTCSQGCLSGYAGAMCDQATTDGTVEGATQAAAESTTKFLIIIAILVVAVLFLIIGVSVLIARKKLKGSTITKQDKNPYQNTRKPSQRDDDGAQYESLEDRGYTNTSTPPNDMMVREYEVPVTARAGRHEYGGNVAYYSSAEISLNADSRETEMSPREQSIQPTMPTLNKAQTRGILKPPKASRFKGKSQDTASDTPVTYEDLQNQGHRHFYDSLRK